MKTIDLSDLKVGDKAWASTYGECFIEAIMNDDDVFPIAIVDSDGEEVGTYTINGLWGKYEKHPTLFHSEQEFRDYWGIQRDIDAPLTKREQFAMAAMQGLLAASPNHFPEDSLARVSIKQADALLTKLNEKL
jgi:hypothetical protein